MANKQKTVTRSVTQEFGQIADSHLGTVVSGERSTIEHSTLPTTDKHLIGYNLIVEHGKALKLSPKTQNHVFYQLAVNEGGSLHIRLSGNEGGGLHSKEWVSVQAVLDLLDSMAGLTIKSTILKAVFKGGSANNAAFLAAVLRSAEIGLLSQSEKSVFIHQLSTDYDERKAALVKLADIPS